MKPSVEWWTPSPPVAKHCSFSKISVLVPTRQRVPQLRTMIDSFNATTTVRDSAELVFRIDADDHDTQDFLRYLWPPLVLIGQRLDGYRSLPTFFDELRRVSSGDVLMCGNDDMVFRTPDWSSLVLAEANKYPDGLFNIAVDTLNAGNVPWSIVSSHAVDLMGFIHDKRLIWGDLFLRDVMAAFGRVISLPTVRIEHHWMGFTPDEVFLAGDQQHPANWDAAYWELHRACVAEAVARLDADHRQGPAV